MVDSAFDRPSFDTHIPSAAVRALSFLEGLSDKAVCLPLQASSILRGVAPGTFSSHCSTEPSARVPRDLHVLHSPHLTGPVRSTGTAIFLSFLKQTFLTGLLGDHRLLSSFASPACSLESGLGVSGRVLEHHTEESSSILGISTWKANRHLKFNVYKSEP